jgi:hypothetical protein
MNKIEIALSKKKTFLMLLGSLGFVAIGIAFIIKPYIFAEQYQMQPFIKIVGIIATLFFGAAGIYAITKILDKTPGLIIDEYGITDNTNGASIGLIKWSDITDIQSALIVSQKFVLVYVKNPQEYINKTKGIKRKILQGNNKMYGTPLALISNILKCNFNELEKQILDRFQKQSNLLPST